MLNHLIKGPALAMGLLMATLGSAQPSAAAPPYQLAYGYRGSRLTWRVYPRPSRYRIGGFARSSHCAVGKQAVTALTPPPQSGDSIDAQSTVVNATLSSHPTFWLHVPQTQPTQAFFSLQTADASQETELYSTEISLSGEAGVIGIQLPRSAPGLEEGETYLWQVLVQCVPNSYEGALHLGSWIERLNPDQLLEQGQRPGPPLTQRLAQAPAEERALIYADLGIWQDTISTLAEQRYRNPEDARVQDDWAALLNATQMRSFVRSPILKIF